MQSWYSSIRFYNMCWLYIFQPQGSREYKMKFQEDAEWLNWRNRFSSLYDSLNYSRGLQGFVMREGHKLLEKRYVKNHKFSKVLEIGAGCGEHTQFVRHEFDEYHLTDLNPNVLAYAKKNLDSNNLTKYQFSVQGETDLHYPNEVFDRVIAAHVLEHIYKPHLALLEWKRVIKHGGTISVLIPCDPGILWRIGRIFARKKMTNLGLNYDYIMAREHVNPCNNLIVLLQHIFPNSHATWWPSYVPSIDMNLFFAFHATVTK